MAVYKLSELIVDDGENVLAQGELEVIAAKVAEMVAEVPAPDAPADVPAA